MIFGKTSAERAKIIAEQEEKLKNGMLRFVPYPVQLYDGRIAVLRRLWVCASRIYKVSSTQTETLYPRDRLGNLVCEYFNTEEDMRWYMSRG